MKRSPLRPKGAPPPREATQITYTPRARAVAVADPRARLTVSLPRPKSPPARSETYRRLVAAMPCAHCGRSGPSQAAHSDADGKGMSIKAPDQTCFPLCADSPGRPGCHSIIGTSGTFKREHRRHLETTYAAKTRSAILAAGLWPADLPTWPGDVEDA